MMNDLSALASQCADAGCTELAVVARFLLAAQQPPWQGTGIEVRRGQVYTLLARGRVQWSAQRPQLYGGPGFHLWARVAPGGHIVNVTRETGTFTADRDGELELGIYFGMWQDASGRLATSERAYARLQGTIEVVMLLWHGAAASGLAALGRRVEHALLAQECARLSAQPTLPADWAYLPEAGYSDIYRACHHAGERAVCLNAEDDQGILRKSVDCVLDATTTLSWSWQLLEHPSGVAEDSPYSHDYVSVGAEFEDGRDLTWIWSCALPRAAHFPCPIKAWSARETHLVVRNGDDPTATWVHERRCIHDDTRRALGAAPARVVAVWLIAVATFQHGRARARFKDIVLADRTQHCQVL
jgi:hypothetical protein